MDQLWYRLALRQRPARNRATGQPWRNVGRLQRRFSFHAQVRRYRQVEDRKNTPDVGERSRRAQMRSSFVFVPVLACAVSCSFSVLAADEESKATQVPSEETSPDSTAKDPSEESSPSLPVVDLGNRKAETIAGTGSPDGRLALAWTLRPSKDAEP